MTERDANLNQLFFPSQQTKSSPAWLKILAAPALIAILANFTPDLLEAVKAELRTAVEGLFQINLLSLLLQGWNKYGEVREALESSRKNPKDAILKQVVDHTLKVEQHPYIELFKDDLPVVGGKIEFTFAAALDVKGLTLKIQNGRISEIATGSCTGSLKLLLTEGGVIAELDTGEFDLPGSIELKSDEQAETLVAHHRPQDDKTIASRKPGTSKPGP
ncbi:MAG TPA: hypothetical protein VLZ89_01505 [Anaerolineales bacterium]|nr:hypothetical protein [Anaerolineales bacterium]